MTGSASAPKFTVARIGGRLKACSIIDRGKVIWHVRPLDNSSDVQPRGRSRCNGAFQTRGEALAAETLLRKVDDRYRPQLREAEDAFDRVKWHHRQALRETLS